jgi:hypothetical protein
MNFKLPPWLDIVLIVVTVLILTIGAVKTVIISGTPTVDQAIGNCLPGGALLAVFIVLKIFLAYDLATLLVVISVMGSLVIFYYGFVDSDKERKNLLITFAGSLLGFGTGIPIGKALSKEKE